jgi:hypothetical protein
MAPCLSERFRVVYFPCPKVLGTTMRHFLFEQDNGYPFPAMRLNGKAIELYHLFGQPGPFVPVQRPPGYLRMAIVRDPVRRFVSAYRNRVQHYHEADDAELKQHGIKGVPGRPDIATFVSNFAAYQKLPKIAHHTRPQNYFLGRDIRFYDRVFQAERVDELEAFLAERGGRPVTLPRMRDDGPAMRAEDLPVELRRAIARLYVDDYVLTGARYSPP